MRASARSRPGRWRSGLELRRTVRALLRDLEMDAPLDVALLCERLGERRGRPIRLTPHQLPVPGPFGLWIATADTDVIAYQEATTVGHQEHIVLHEIGHIVSDHTSGTTMEDARARLLPDLVPGTVVPGLVVPGLVVPGMVVPGMVGRALARSAYDEAHEWEAETVATVIKEWAALLEGLAPPADRGTPSARRVRGAFDDHQGWL